LHQSAGTKEELIKFGDRLGLARAGLENKPGSEAIHLHYDVVERVRLKAIHLGGCPESMLDGGSPPITGSPFV
jgi:hypothetical protein